ncbi:MAG: tetratricopeptide repeat protein [Verrucomicrobiaceae bacterium]|nr:tetratricopeptide repeat protein [Verrucomicrobiaceae bacterium]
MNPARPADPYRIFLSGATADFAEVRIGFSDALRRGQLHVIHQADFPQSQADTVLKLAQLIAPCGILIHLIGRQPGSVADSAAVREYLAVAEREGGFLKNMPGLRAQLGDCSGLTYTQWEVFIALHLGLAVFVFGDATHADPAHPQRQHLDRLIDARRYTDSFTDAADLKDKVWAALLWHYRQTQPAAPLPEVLRPQNLPGGYVGRLFLGRDDFLEKVHASLLGGGHATAITQQSAVTDPQSRIAINGLGGIGKTHTAVAYAQKYAGDYTALLFVSGDSPERLLSSLAALCGVLHLDREGPLPPDDPGRVAAAVEWLAAHAGWLLIVDNVDDEASVAALTGLLGHLTRGHVLITSRLHSWADHVTPLDLEVLSPDAAAELLRALARHRRGDHAADTAAAHRLANEILEGLPLAIHQAAGYINEQRLTFEDALAHYREQADGLLGWFRENIIHYHGPEELGPRPVLITWKSSFDQLAPDTRRWLRVFAHHAPAPIPEFLLETRPAMSEEVKARHRAALAALAQAESYSLLTRDARQPQFKMHRLVQQIIRRSATPEENAAALAEGIRLIEESDPGDPQDVRTWPRWNPLQAHAQALCDHAPDQPAPERLSWLLVQLGVLLYTKALHSQAEPLYRRSLALDDASFGKDHPEVAIDLNNLAELLRVTNRHAEAEPLMRRALGIDETSFGKEHPKVAIRLNNLAQLLQDTNRHAEAEPLMRRVVDIFEKSLGKDHPNVAASLNNLAALLQATNRHAEAEPLMRRALGIDEASFGKEHPEVAIRLNNLAQLLQATNRHAEAEPLMRRALDIDEASFGKEHPNVARDLNNLAALLQATNRLAEAEPLMRRALDIDEASFGKEHPKVAIRLNNLAQLLKDTNRHAEAEPLMRRALDIFTASFGPEHPHTQTVQGNLDALLADK